MAQAPKVAVKTSPMTRQTRVAKTSLMEPRPERSTTATITRESIPASFAPLVTLLSSSYCMGISPVSMTVTPRSGTRPRECEICFMASMGLLPGSMDS